VVRVVQADPGVPPDLGDLAAPAIGRHPDTHVVFRGNGFIVLTCGWPEESTVASAQYFCCHDLSGRDDDGVAVRRLLHLGCAFGGNSKHYEKQGREADSLQAMKQGCGEFFIAEPSDG